MVEILSLLGLSHAVYVLVYMMFHAGNFLRSFLPTLFFIVLGVAFLFGAAESRWQDIIPYYQDIKWGLWASFSPLSTLLILKVMRMTKEPPSLFWLLLLIVPLAYLSANLLSSHVSEVFGWYQVNAIILGTLSLLIVWTKRGWLDALHKRKNGRERYWLIICLIMVNIGLLSTDFALLNTAISYESAEMIRIVIAIAFVYIASTSLFRIFPHVLPVKNKVEGSLSVSEIQTALKIEDLLYLEKVYQEPSYGRSDMAKELNLSESNLSKIVKIYFEKGVPQLLNEQRVKESKDLLLQTDVDITIISSEAGFNSIATFNRVFKGIEGISPTEYRQKKR